MVKFGDRLKALRIAKDMTQEDLAYAAEIVLSQVHRLETAKTNATLSTLTIRILLLYFFLY